MAYRNGIGLENPGMTGYRILIIIPGRKRRPEGSHHIAHSVRHTLKTAYVIPPTRGRMGGFVFRRDFGIGSC
jgi:hypothetical protein